MRQKEQEYEKLKEKDMKEVKVWQTQSKQKWIKEKARFFQSLVCFLLLQSAIKAAPGRMFMENYTQLISLNHCNKITERPTSHPR